MFMIELQRKKKLDILEAVRHAVSSCVQTWKTIDYDFDSKEVVAIEQDGTRLPFHLLSDGVRNMLSLVADCLSHGDSKSASSGESDY